MSFSSAFTADTTATSAGETDNDPYNLERFITAQDQGGAFDKVLAAFRGGHRKPSPTTWMWFVFPQMDHCQTQSLRVKLSEGHSRYEDVEEQTWREKDVWPKGQPLTSLDEARTYLRHPILGPRVREAATAVLNSPFADKFSLMDNFSMDVARLHSSMTIFRQATRFPQCIHDKRRPPGENGVFAQVINRFFVSYMCKDEENDWLDFDDKKLMTYKRGSRHKPTLEHLDQTEQVEIERRLKKGLGCVCGRAQEILEKMDKGTHSKMEKSRVAMEKEKQRMQKALERKRKEQDLQDNEIRTILT